MNFQQHYCNLFATFGYPLAESDGVSATAIDKAAKSLNITIPTALKDYYLVAGREQRFNQCFQRLLSVSEWSVDRSRLVFMEENQAVVLWGVSLSSNSDNPTVFQRGYDNEADWFLESRHCSDFITVMLHYNAVSGGFEHGFSIAIPPDINSRLLQGWTCHSTENRLTAYSRQNQVVCIEPDLGLMAAAKSAKDLAALRRDLQI